MVRYSSGSGKARGVTFSKEVNTRTNFVLRTKVNILRRCESSGLRVTIIRRQKYIPVEVERISRKFPQNFLLRSTPK
jgi:hypothetical protein